MNLGSITNLQRMNGVSFVCFDDGTPQHQVPDFNGLQLVAFDSNDNQSGAVTFENIIPDPLANPAGSAFLADIVGQQVSNGPITIKATGQQANFGAFFVTPVSITVTLDPSLPGFPTHWVVTPGTITPK